MPDPKRQMAVEGPLLERVKRQTLLFLLRFLRLGYRALTLPLKEVRAEVASLRAAAVESLAYVGVELRRLGDLVEQGRGAGEGQVAEHGAPLAAGSTIVEAPFAFRCLADVESPGPILVVGEKGAAIDASLSSLGYEVTHVHSLEELVDEPTGFGAVLYLPSHPDGGELERIGTLLSDSGVLVMSVPFGSAGGNGAGAVLDDGALDSLLSGWAVAERIVVADGQAGRWAPVQNGHTPERGITLVAARRADSGN
jgi:hypothetical protein